LDLNAYIGASEREQEWCESVREALHPEAQYHQVEVVRLVGIMLVVFIRQEHLESMYDVAMGKLGTGILNIVGNKGGVAVRFEVSDTKFCFVTSHLAAHAEELEKRNQDFHSIREELSLVDPDMEPHQTYIDNHHLVFWFGDLNYRITGLENSEVISLVHKRKFDELSKYDQLGNARREGHVFQDYSEGNIDFAPTFKYDVGTDTFDSSEKQRCPSWTDRVLWKGDDVTQLSYTSLPTLRLSDHKPVTAVFDVQV